VQAQPAQAQPTKAPVTGTSDGIALERRAATAKAADGGERSQLKADQKSSYKNWRRHWKSATSASTENQGTRNQREHSRPRRQSQTLVTALLLEGEPPQQGQLMAATRVQAQPAQAQPTKAPVTRTGDGIALERRATTAKAADGGERSQRKADQKSSYKHWRRHWRSATSARTENQGISPSSLEGEPLQPKQQMAVTTCERNQREHSRPRRQSQALVTALALKSEPPRQGQLMAATRVQAQPARAQPTKAPVTGPSDGIALERRAA
jgi:hypothetical protein